MNRPQRDLLIEHLEGEVPIRRPSSSRNPDERIMLRTRCQVMESLVGQGLLRYDRPMSPFRATIITDEGRKRLAAILADWADALVRVGYDGIGNPRRPVAPRIHSRESAPPQHFPLDSAHD